MTMGPPMLMGKGTMHLWHHAEYVQSVSSRRPRQQPWMEAAEKAAARRLTNLDYSWPMPSVTYLAMTQMPMTITDVLSPLAIIFMIIMYTIPCFVVLTPTGAKNVSKGRAARWPKLQPSGAERAMVLRIVYGEPIGYHLRARTWHPKEALNMLHIGTTIIIGIIKYIDRHSVMQAMTLLMVVTIMTMVTVTYYEKIGPRRSRAADYAKRQDSSISRRLPNLPGRLRQMGPRTSRLPIRRRRRRNRHSAAAWTLVATPRLGSWTGVSWRPTDPPARQHRYAAAGR